MNIRLSNTTSKTSSLKDMEVGVLLGNEQRLLPVNEVDENINLYEVFKKEREESNLIRLTCKINPICANPIFNHSTEVVRNEGAGSCSVLLNNTQNGNISGTYGKPSSFKWNRYEAIRDTQLSSTGIGYVYHCGWDIFNNHRLRSKYFKCVCPIVTGTKNFNTIDDVVRDADGKELKRPYDPKDQSKKWPETAVERLYTDEDVYTYEQSYLNNLSERNGWFGFYNKSTLRDNNLVNNGYEFDRVINSRSANDFIEMYPDSTLYSFVPKYNKSRHRLEYNWKYYLTYPYKSIKDFYAIDKDSEGLLCTGYRDNYSTSTLYSIAPHGLSVGDYVNVYTNGELTHENMRVIGVGDGTGENDKFAFSINNAGDPITDEWIDLDECTLIKTDGSFYYLYRDSIVIKVFGGASRATFSWKESSGTTIGDEVSVVEARYVPYHIENDVPVKQTVSFKRSVGGCECEYYVRLFTKIPNWKVSDKPLTKGLARNISQFSKFTGGKLTGQRNTEQFQSMTSKIGFSKNIYGDQVCQIVFNDDIDLTGLVDNLGRPVTDIYLTLVKNNAGYKEWYEQKNFTSSAVEYSHAFGKVSCGFVNSYESLANSSIPNVMKNSYDIAGLNVGVINGKSGFTDEIDGDKQTVFYGDICYLDRTKCEEHVLSELYFRFNTGQREMYDTNFDYTPFYDEIDGYTSVKYNGILNIPEPNTKSVAQAQKCLNARDFTREGYIYKAHHRIAIHGLSTDYEEQQPKMFKITRIITTGHKLLCTTSDVNYVEVGDEMMVYNMSTMEYITIKAKSVDMNTLKTFEYTVESGDIARVCVGDNLVLLRKDATIPEYAIFVNDGTMRYVWKTFIKNGTDVSTNDTEHQFANGRFYVQDEMIFTLHRQDPHEKVEEYSGIIINSENIKSVNKSYSSDDYVTSDKMSCRLTNG